VPGANPVGQDFLPAPWQRIENTTTSLRNTPRTPSPNNARTATGDVPYYGNSLKPFAKVVRNHWGIANTCHWSLDAEFREDASRARDRNLAENLSWLRRFALRRLKQHPDKKTGLVGKRRQCGWSTRYLSEVLFGKAG
jgi:hypothetical protein